MELATPTQEFLENMQAQVEKIPMEDRKMVNELMTKDYFLETRKIYHRYHEICCRPNIKWYVTERRLCLRVEDTKSAMQVDVELRKWLYDVMLILNAHIYAQLGISQEVFENSRRYWIDHAEQNPDFQQELIEI